jgi:8-oxo-dGTP pyrophosphatase MutT (NUDIX family)
MTPDAESTQPGGAHGGTPRGPERWQRGAQRVLASTRILELRAVGYRHDGRAVEREFVVIHAPDWVNVLALTPDGRLVLVRQFRYGINAFSLEIPGGVIEAGEAPLEAGLRELREETGYTGIGGRVLASLHPNPAIQDNQVHFVLVEEAALRRATDWDPDEEIEVLTAPVEEVLEWARSGVITHSLVVGALMQFEPVWRQWAAQRATQFNRKSCKG